MPKKTKKTFCVKGKSPKANCLPIIITECKTQKKRNRNLQKPVVQQELDSDSKTWKTILGRLHCLQTVLIGTNYATRL